MPSVHQSGRRRARARVMSESRASSKVEYVHQLVPQRVTELRVAAAKGSVTRRFMNSVTTENSLRRHAGMTFVCSKSV